jgi:hypothetical protein
MTNCGMAWNPVITHDSFHLDHCNLKALLLSIEMTVAVIVATGLGCSENVHYKNIMATWLNFLFYMYCTHQLIL